MAFPRNSLRAFLSHAKKNLTTALQQSQKVTIVIGNESADLDSLTSSLLYAYLRSLAPPRTAFTPLYIPLLNLPASEIRLRPEYTALFRHANISASHLITLDDLPTLSKREEILKPGNTRWILVDHNRLQGTLGSIYSTRVHGVIDHHDEEQAVAQETQPEPRVVEKCGSCTSLVLRTFKSAWDASSSSSLSSGAAHAQGESSINDSIVVQTWDAQVAKFALASILMDTTNLTAKGKVQAVDREAVKYLEAKILASTREATTWDRTHYFKEIDEAKRDIEGLALGEILRKDYKEWEQKGIKLGISSVVKPMEFLVTKAAKEKPQHHDGNAFDTSIRDFMNARDLSLYAIMTTSTSSEGQFKRELLLQSLPASSPIAAKFAEQAAADLALESLSIAGCPEYGYGTETRGEETWRRIWLQKDLSKSRKQVAPLLRKAMG